MFKKLILPLIVTNTFFINDAYADQQFDYCLDCTPAQVKTFAEQKMSSNNTIFIFNGTSASKWGWHTESSNDEIDEQAPSSYAVSLALTASDKSAENKLKEVRIQLNSLKIAFNELFGNVQVSFDANQYNSSSALVALDPVGFALLVNEHIRNQAVLVNYLANEIQDKLEQISSQINSPLYSMTASTAKLSNDSIIVTIKHDDGSFTYVRVEFSGRLVGGKVFLKTKVDTLTTKDGRTIPITQAQRGVLNGSYTSDNIDQDSFENALRNIGVEVEVKACSSIKYITCSQIRKTESNGNVYWSPKCTRHSTRCGG